MTTIRAALLAMILALAITGYLLLLLGSSTSDLPKARTLKAPGTGEPGVHIYLEVAGVDAIREAMQVRVSMVPPDTGVENQSPSLGRDLVLLLAHDQQQDRIELQAHQSLPETTIELDLEGGDITRYPLDAYHAGLWIRCFERSATPGADPTLLPIDVTIWERVLGFRLRTDADARGTPGEIRLTFDIRRSRASLFFVLAAYGAMVVLACSALTIATLAFLRVRRAEPTLVGALGAIVFAMPALRNALPGGAPVGVLADVFVFIWAELAAVLALALLVGTWARSGPRP